MAPISQRSSLSQLARARAEQIQRKTCGTDTSFGVRIGTDNNTRNPDTRGVGIQVSASKTQSLPWLPTQANDNTHSHSHKGPININKVPHNQHNAYTTTRGEGFHQQAYRAPPKLLKKKEKSAPTALPNLTANGLVVHEEGKPPLAHGHGHDQNHNQIHQMRRLDAQHLHRGMTQTNGFASATPSTVNALQRKTFHDQSFGGGKSNQHNNSKPTQQNSIKHLSVDKQIELARDKIQALTRNEEGDGLTLTNSTSLGSNDNNISGLVGKIDASHRLDEECVNYEAIQALTKEKKSKSEGRLRGLRAIRGRHAEGRDKRSRLRNPGRHGNPYYAQTREAQADQLDGRMGEKDEKEDTFYRAVESPKHRPIKLGDLTPRTEKAGSSTRRAIERGDWNLLQEFDSVSYLLQEERDHRREICRRREHMHQLDRQKEDAKRREYEEKQDIRNFGKTLEADAVLFRKEQYEKILQNNEKDMDQRRIRDIQLRGKLQRYDDERARDQKENDNMMNVTKRALEKEEDKKAQKMIESKAWAARMKHDNEASIQRRKDQKIADNIEDKRLMAIQVEIWDAQLAARVAYFENLKGKQGDLAKKYAELIGAAEEKKRREENERVQAEIRQRDNKLAEASIAKEKWLSDLRSDGLKAVRKQLEEQTAKRKADKDENDRFGVQYTTDAEKYRQEEAEKGEKRRREARENAAFLRKQMSEPKELVGKFGVESMSEAEKAINKPELRQAQAGLGHEAIFRNKQFQLLGTAPQSDRHLSPILQSREKSEKKARLLDKFGMLTARKGIF